MATWKDTPNNNEDNFRQLLFQQVYFQLHTSIHSYLVTKEETIIFRATVFHLHSY